MNPSLLPQGRYQRHSRNPRYKVSCQSEIGFSNSLWFPSGRVLRINEIRTTSNWGGRTYEHRTAARSSRRARSQTMPPVPDASCFRIAFGEDPELGVDKGPRGDRISQSLLQRDWNVHDRDAYNARVACRLS